MATKIGQALVVDSAALRRSRNRIALISVVGGCLVGVYIAQLSGAARVSPERGSVPAPLVSIGHFLCRDWGGLYSISHQRENRYTFSCGRHATFADIEVTLGPQNNETNE